MVETRKLVKVFLASPSDLASERRAAKVITDEANALLAPLCNYQLELVGWEDTVSVFGRPQATINRELQRCDLFIGLMWKRWGTPPDTAGSYTSGFEEEFQTSMQRRVADGRPEISLFFKEIDDELVRDPGDQLQKVLAFKRRLVDAKQVLFEQFTAATFEAKFRRCIFSYVSALRSEEQVEAGGAHAPALTDKVQPTRSEDATTDVPIPPEGVQFLQSFLSSMGRDTDERTEVTSAARFRLLATLVGVQGNDEPSLGIHDANMLYIERNRFGLSHREKHALMEQGLLYFREENVPLWHWLGATNGFAERTLSVYATGIPLHKVKVGALKAMTMIADPLDVENFSRQAHLDAWFEADSSSDVKVAALEYLAECGIPADLPSIRSEFDEAHFETAQAAVEATLRIELRDSTQRAVEALYELQPLEVKAEVLADLFRNGGALTTECAVQGLKHACAGVRRACVQLVAARKALSVEMAEALTRDSDPGVKYEALIRLTSAGRPYSDEEAKALLAKEAEPGPFGAAASSDGDYYTKFRLHSLRSQPDSKLAEIADAPGLDRDAKFAYEERHFDQLGDDIRMAVDEEYEKEWQSLIKRFEERFADAMDLVERLRSLEATIRREFTQRGLAILCRKAAPVDLGRIRANIKTGMLKDFEGAIEYLRQRGEWEDIGIVLESAKRVRLSPPQRGGEERLAARAIYALGRGRLKDVLTMHTKGRWRAYLVAEMPERAFAALEDSTVGTLLQSDDEALRKATALKCVRVCSQKRLARMLADYISSDSERYYNVIHWLDFGAALTVASGLTGSQFHRFHR